MSLLTRLKSCLLVFKGISNIFLELVFPRRCAACNQFYVSDGFTPKTLDQKPSPLETIADQICASCSETLHFVSEPICTICGCEFQSTHTHNHPCGQCQRRSPPFERARSVVTYSGPLRRVVHQFKYQSVAGLGDGLGRLLAWGFCQWYQEQSYDFIIPVPLHVQRLRQRGFNQTELMVRSWKRALPKRGPKPMPIPMVTNALRRIRATTPQNQLRRSQRLTNIKGAFSVRRPALLKNKSVLLVDDVFTTGATISECARMLRRCGTRRIDALTLARV